MNEVPNLRMFGARLLQCFAAIVLGFPSGYAIAMHLPQGHGREASAFAPVFLIVVMGIGLTMCWFALFDAIRRRTMTATVTVPSNLPVARVVRRGRDHGGKIWRHSRRMSITCQPRAGASSSARTSLPTCESRS